MDLFEKGTAVVYRARHPGHEAEQGLVTSFNRNHVFVNFGHGSTSAGCSPDSLTFLSGEPVRPAFEDWWAEDAAAFIADQRNSHDQ